MSGAQALLEQLRSEGVRHIFGNPGTSEGAIMASLEAYPDLRYILVAQEGVAMGAADGYARATGRPAFVSLHIETGLSNGLSLLFNAFAGGTPLVLSAANSDVGRQVAGRTDLAGLVRPFTKWSAEAAQAEQIPGLVRRAFTEARTPPTGPAFVGFASNALDATADVDVVPSASVFARVAPDPRGVDRAVAALVQADRPAIVLGDRVAQYDAVAEAVGVAERLGARVYGASYPAMLFPTNHPQWCGPLAAYMPAYREALGPADAVLVVGAKAFHAFFDPPVQVLNPSARLVHLDCNAGEIGQSQPTDVGILADVKFGLRALATALEAGMTGAQKAAASARAAELAQQTAVRRAALNRPNAAGATGGSGAEGGDGRPMRPSRLMAELAAALPANAIVVDDAVSSRPALHAAHAFTRPGEVHAERAGGAIGWGMGAALGVQLAHPDEPVVAVVGDGSAMMTAQALWTASAYGIPAVYVICNNAGYRILKMNLRRYFRDVLGDPERPSRYIGMDVPQPWDLAAVARAMGVAGERIEDPAAIGPALRWALAARKPALLDVVIDPAL